MPEAEPLVEVVVEDPRWQEVEIAALAERAARAALTAVGGDPAASEVALLACDDARIAALNAAFRGMAQPTNVLAWPAGPGAFPELGSGRGFLGDVALGFDTCAREAQAAGIPLADHATHLVVHGVLHLLGHDHATAGETAAMQALESKILATLGLPNPYSRQGRPSGAASG